MSDIQYQVLGVLLTFLEISFCTLSEDGYSWFRYIGSCRPLLSHTLRKDSESQGTAPYHRNG